MSAEVEWDGEALVGWVSVDGVAMKVRADRDMIHAQAPGFNDAVTWEIERHRAEIFEKLTQRLVEAAKDDRKAGLVVNS
jgi:hypothetical protein